MADLQNTIRIYQNIQTLLSEGQFPGGAAHAIAEAQSLIADCINTMTADLANKDQISEQQQQNQPGV